MARYVKGDLVLMPFPFSGEAGYKHRPALVLASWDYAGGTDYLTCLVTTQKASDPHLMSLTRTDTAGGSLAQDCYLRPTYLFATDEQQISRRLDHLKPDKLNQVLQTVVNVLASESR